MNPETTPAAISQRRFKTGLRGFDRDEVTTFLAEIARHLEELIAQRDRLAGRLGDFAGRDLQSEFASIGHDVAAILETARLAADGMRERASSDAARWRSEAMAEAEGLVREARADAEHLRGDAWSTGEEMLKQAQAEAHRIKDVAERDALTVLGEAEREAHRLTASSRRESDDQLRAARMEAESLIADAGARHDEMLDQARRQAESAQERAVALELRRQELMSELETLRASLSRMEGELDERRQRLEPVEPIKQDATPLVTRSAVPAEQGPWEPGETVRVIHRGKPPANKVPDAEDIADEVRRIRREASTPEPQVQTMPVEPAPTPEPAPMAALAAPTGAPMTGDDLSDIFRRLRIPAALTADSAALPDQPEAETPPEPSTQTPVVGEASIPNEVFELRDRLLLPVTNRSLRNLKRQLTELQNQALEDLRVSEGAWRPSKETIIDPMRAELLLLTAESFAAGHAAAEEMVGERLPRPPAPVREDAHVFGSALIERLNSVLQGDAHGVRAAGASVSMIFRAWRTDEAERRVRDLANTEYHHGLRSSLEGSRRKLSWVVWGRGCASCRTASEKGSETPPAHPGCGCTLIIHAPTRA